MSNQEYHMDSTHVSSSQLKKLIDKSPAHFHIQKEATKSTDWGIALHCFILEHERFYREYKAIPEGMDFRTKEGKKWKEDNEAMNLIKYEDILAFETIHKKLFNHPLYCKYLENGGAEESFFSEINGVKVKVRPDYLVETPIGYACIDLKTTQSCKPDDVSRDIVKYHYDLSAVMYREVLRTELKAHIDFVWLFIEKEEPYEMLWCEMSDQMHEFGNKRFEKSLAIYKDTVAKGKFPGYQETGSITEIYLPSYIKGE